MKGVDTNFTWIKINYNESVPSKIKINSKDYLFIITDKNKILRTSDDGKNWAYINNNLPEEEYPYLYIGPKDRLFIITASNKLYYSSNDGNYWNDITYNLNGKTITSIASISDTAVFASTKDGDIYKISPSITNVDRQRKDDDIPNQYTLYQNYPNPFNPTTTISYLLPEGNTVKIKVFDTLGKEVTTLINEYKSAGYHSVQYNAEGLPSGL